MSDINKYENDEKELDEEFGDFDLPPAKYQIWLFHYDEDDNILDEENLLFTFSDPDPAMVKAKELVNDIETLKRYATPKTAYFGIEVETVVEFEDHSENVGTLFAEYVVLKN